MKSKYYVNPEDDPSTKVLKCYHHSMEAFTTAREDSEVLMRYAAANLQWDDDVLTEAVNHKKPHLTYNIILPMLMTMQGNEQLARRRAKIKPNYRGQESIVEIIQGRWNGIVDEQEIENKLQSCFYDALITKVGGWMQRDIVINEEGYLDFKYSVPKNMNIHPDPKLLQSDYMLENIRYLIKESWMTLDDIVAKYELGYIPDKAESKYWWQSLSEVIKNFTDSFFSSKSEFHNKENDTYKVLEMQERVAEKSWVCWDGEGYFRFTDDEYLKAREFNKQLQKIRDIPDCKIKFITTIPHFQNMVVYNKTSKIQTRNFDVFPMYSYSFNIQSCEGTCFVHLMKDLQDDLNKSKSQFRDLVTQLASGATIVKGREKEAVDKLMEEGNQPNQVINLKGQNSDIKRLEPGMISPEIPNQEERTFAHAERISQVTPTVKGQTERSGESGVLFQKKLEAASAAINPYFFNLSMLRKAIVKDFVDLFPKVYYDENRVITIKDKKGVRQQVIANLNYAGQKTNDMQNASMYVELDEGEDNKTVREENFNQLLALSQLIAQINPAYVDVVTLLESAPITGVEKFIEHIQNQMQAQAGQQDQVTQLENTKTKLENDNLAKDIQNKDDKIKLDAIKLAIEREKISSQNTKTSQKER